MSDSDDASHDNRDEDNIEQEEDSSSISTSFSSRDAKRTAKLARRDAAKQQQAPKLHQPEAKGKKERRAKEKATVMEKQSQKKKEQKENVEMKDAEEDDDKDEENDDGDDSGEDSDGSAGRTDRKHNDDDDESDVDAPTSLSATAAAAAAATKKAAATGRLFSGLRVGQIITGLISGVEKFGLFVEFLYKKKERKGMCHISMCSDAYIRDLNQEYAVGDCVEAIVTKLDAKTGHISLGLKASLFPKDHPPKPIVKLRNAVPLRTKEEEKEAANADKNTKLESIFITSLASKSAPTESEARYSTIKRFLQEVQGTGVQKLQKKNRLGQRERRKLITAVLGEEAEKKLLKEKNGKMSWKKERKAAEADAAASSSSTSSLTQQAASSSSSDPLSTLGLNRREKRLLLNKQLAERGEARPEFMQQLKEGKFERAAGSQKPKRGGEFASGGVASMSDRQEEKVERRLKFEKVEMGGGGSTRPHHSTSTSSSRPPSSTSSSSKRTTSSAPTPAAAPAADETMHPSWQAKQIQAAKIAAAAQAGGQRKKMKLSDD